MMKLTRKAVALAGAAAMMASCNHMKQIKHMPYPETQRTDVVDDYFGTKVADPYRWLEDDNSEATAAWVKAQNAVTQDYLSQIPFRDAIRGRLTQLWNYPKEGIPAKHGDAWYYFYNDGLQNQSVLYRTTAPGAQGEVFLNPNTLSDDGTVALSSVAFSKDGKYCACAVAESGSDWVEIRVMNTADRTFTTDKINWVKFSGAEWAPDSKGFYYSAYDAPEKGVFSSQNQFQKVYYHRLGTPQSADKLIYMDAEHPLRYFSCIGQWKRTIGDPSKKNSIIESFNRNFKGRNDGSAQTHAFLASPEIVMAMAINGDLTFNPMKGSYTTAKGTTIKLKAPTGTELPVKGFVTDLTDCIRPDYAKIEIKVSPNAKRIKLLEPFPAWDGKDFVGLPILIKAKGKCTTDHISPGGKWLAYRGNLDRISDNLLERAVNGFTDAAGKTLNYETGTYDTPAKVARYYKNHKIDSIIIGDDNYGEGSSREHAAMEPRYLGVRVVLTKSLARIHESNLKKQGVLALTFVNPADYDKIKEKDRVSVLGLDKLAPGQNVTIELTHADGKKERFEAKHSYNAKQLAWFKAGSALNAL